MENEQKKDRRVIKTQKAIRNAFLKLMVQKDIDDITIKEIAEEADVDRKTIYNYYGGIHEIREELENALVDIFERETQGLCYSIDEAPKSFEILANMLNNNLELYGQLMRLDYNSRLLVKVIDYLKIKIRQGISEQGDYEDAQLDLAAEYVTLGMFAAYRYWFNSDRKKSLKEFSQDVSDMILKGVPAFLDKK